MRKRSFQKIFFILLPSILMFTLITLIITVPEGNSRVGQNCFRNNDALCNQDRTNPCIRERCLTSRCMSDSPDYTSVACVNKTNAQIISPLTPVARPPINPLQVEPVKKIDPSVLLPVSPSGKDDCVTTDHCKEGYYCINFRCTPSCGDGVIVGSEACDFSSGGETILGSACEKGSICARDCSCVAPGGVTPPPACGNGVLEGSESCEAGVTTVTCPAGTHCLSSNCVCIPTP